VQAVAQPLHHGTADENAAFERDMPVRPSVCAALVVSSRCRDVWKLLAGVHQHEAAGAIGVLGHAGREAGLAEQRALLVAGHAADRQSAAPSKPALGSPKSRARGLHLGQQAARDVAGRAAARRPSWLVCMLNSMVREALLTSVACTAPPVSCQISQLSTVPKASSPLLGRLRVRPARGRVSTASLVPEK